MHEMVKTCSLLKEYLLEYCIEKTQTDDPELSRKYSTMQNNRVTNGVLYLKYGRLPLNE